MAKGGNSHRSTLKNEHKPFKSKHASKGQLKNRLKGKVEKSTNSSTSSSHKSISKLQRKNVARQLKENKILETKLTKRIFEGNQGIEKIITIICLTDDISPSDIANQIFNQEPESQFHFSLPSISNINISKFKSNLKIIIPNHDNILNLMDAAKCSDFIVFGLSATKEIESYGETILRALLAQGIPTTFGVIPNLVSTFPNKKNLQLDVKQSLQSYYNHFFPMEDKEKLYSIESNNDNANLLRTLCQKFPSSINWRDSRGWLIGENITIENENVVVEGIVRGQGFNSNRLVHIPGYGDFQVDMIEKLPKSRNKQNNIEMEQDSTVYTPDETRDNLDELNPDEIDMEMDDDEFQDYDTNLGVRSEGKIYFDDGSNQKSHKKVPKGTSEYQSRWFVDDVLDEDDSDIEQQEDEIDQELGEAQDITDTVTEYTENDIHVDLSPEEEQRQLQEYRNMVKDDMEFPDEIELHPDESAISKLKDYRGVKSLSNCNWDVNEPDIEKPSIWGKLFKVANFKASKNKINKNFIKNIQIHQGDRVKIHIKAPSFIIEQVNPSFKPFVIYELFEHEHKLSVLNYSFENWQDYEESVPNKDELIIQYGPRRLIINPIFNQASNNSNNVHKTENFVHQGNTVVATCIAPIMFTNSPVIYFKPNAESTGGVDFIGQGSYLGSDTSRILVKRVVLTGHPVKIHKRVVTIRYMFFNKEDINYFKAVQLFTKSGRSGFIKESLGTHGYLKANFDGKLTSQDIVGMSLYRRVWPEISTLYDA